MLSRSPALAHLPRLLRRNSSRVLRASELRAISTSRISSSAIYPRIIVSSYYTPQFSFSRSFHVSQPSQGLIPESENPPPKESEPSEQITHATETTIEEYHENADAFLDSLTSKLETMQEGRADLEVEFSAGVLNVEVVSKGSWVLNKQPPSKQIWLSSPLSGPKRFDWVVLGESQNQKEGSGSGDWVYLRDGTSLPELLRKELGVDNSTEGEIA